MNPRIRTNLLPGRAPRRPLASVVVALLATLLAGCGADRPATTHEQRSPETTSVIAEQSRPGTSSNLHVLTVRSDHDLEVFDAPADATPARVLPALTPFGSPLALLVTALGKGEDRGWLKVLLPGRPNGGTGWVRFDDIEAKGVDYAVDVDLTQMVLTVFKNDTPVLSTPTAIGDPDHPTPTGLFSLTDKLETGDPAGLYGPFALGLSGRSDVLTEFAGGDGQIGIHGTNDPTSIGRAVSHGCVRVPNDIAAQLSSMLPLGTPVIIH